MLVCDRCGRLIEDDELRFDVEDYGGKSAVPCSCGGTFIEAEQCSVCGEWFDNTDLHGVCEGCLGEYETVGEALAIGAENTTSVDGINGAVAHLLSVEQINNILTKWVEENFTDRSKPIVEYCEDDKIYFSEWLESKYGD